MPHIQFSLPESDIEKFIAKFCSENESPGVTAKRLILEMIGGDRQSSPLPPDIGDRLSDLTDRLEQLETSPPATWQQILGDYDQHVKGIGDRLDALERKQSGLNRLLVDNQNAIKSLQSDAYWSEYGDRLSKVEKLIERQQDIEAVLSDLTEAIANLSPNPAPQETAIMIQKSPIPLAIAPSVCLTHEQAAEFFGKTVATIKKWAKDGDRWPDGWIYDSDKNYWTKEV